MDYSTARAWDNSVAGHRAAYWKYFPKKTSTHVYYYFMEFDSNSEAISSSSVLASVVAENVENWFLALASQWKREASGYSSIGMKIRHPAYQAILGLGPQAVKLILQDLAKGPTHWFPALKRLTGGLDPTPLEKRGDVEAMREAWLAWGRSKNYI